MAPKTLRFYLFSFHFGTQFKRGKFYFARGKRKNHTHRLVLETFSLISFDHLVTRVIEAERWRNAEQTLLARTSRIVNFTPDDKNNMYSELLF